MSTPYPELENFPDDFDGNYDFDEDYDELIWDDFDDSEETEETNG